VLPSAARPVPDGIDIGTGEADGVALPRSFWPRCRRVGWNQSNLSKLERGEHRPGIDDVLRLRYALRLDSVEQRRRLTRSRELRRRRTTLRRPADITFPE
jgi:hypothetical protein